MNIKERMKRLAELRRQAVPHHKMLSKIVNVACIYTGEDPDENNEWAFDYIHNGGNLKHIFKMLGLYKDKRFKDAGKELKRYAEKLR